VFFSKERLFEGTYKNSAFRTNVIRKKILNFERTLFDRTTSSRPYTPKPYNPTDQLISLAFSKWLKSKQNLLPPSIYFNCCMSSGIFKISPFLLSFAQKLFRAANRLKVVLKNCCCLFQSFHAWVKKYYKPQPRK
jgi:hypothetical protein